MELVLLVILLALLAVFAERLLRVRTTVYDWQRGLLYERGAYVRSVGAGRYTLWRHRDELTVVDTRPFQLLVAGQEVLTHDSVSVKLSVVVHGSVTNPARALHDVADWRDSVYLAAQLAVRDAVASLGTEELLEAARGLGQGLLAPVAAQSERWGVTVTAVDVKDVMLPGPLKNAFSAVLVARKQGQAALERARGETAALRKLANAAKLVEKSPGLLQLRALQSVEGGGTVVFDGSGGGAAARRAAAPEGAETDR